MERNFNAIQKIKGEKVSFEILTRLITQLNFAYRISSNHYKPQTIV